MGHLCLIAGFVEALRQVLRDHDGAMLPARAANGNGQIAFPLVDVMRQQINQQVGDALQKFLGLRKRPNVLGDLPGSRPVRETELRHEMQDWEGSVHIEHQIGILGHAMPEAKAHAGYEDALLRLLLLKAFGDVGAQLVNIELGGIDDQVGDGANRDAGEVPAPVANDDFDGHPCAERMGPAGFAVSAQ